MIVDIPSEETTLEARSDEMKEGSNEDKFMHCYMILEMFASKVDRMLLAKDCANVCY